MIQTTYKIQIKLFKLKTILNKNKWLNLKRRRQVKCTNMSKCDHYLIKQILCLALSLGCQHDTTHICCWAPSSAIDRSSACGALSSKPAARRGCRCLSMGQTDGQKDARPFHRLCCVHYAVSVNKDLKYELAMQDAILCFDWVLTIVPLDTK